MNKEQFSSYSRGVGLHLTLASEECVQVAVVEYVQSSMLTSVEPSQTTLSKLIGSIPWPKNADLRPAAPALTKSQLLCS